MKHIWLLVPCLWAGYGALVGQSLEWVFLQSGETAGNCLSFTDCTTDDICYAMEYRSAFTGTITDYDLSFDLTCLGLTMPYRYSLACGMNGGSTVGNGCSEGMGWSMRSFATGQLPVTAGEPVILSQVCFSIPPGGTFEARQDPDEDFTVSVREAASGVNYLERPVFNNGGPFTVDRAGCFNALLPVDWLSFSAQPDQKYVNLHWRVANEIDHDAYHVEHRGPNSTEFTSIATIDRADYLSPEGHLDYRFRHDAPGAGENAYRIRQVDVDGSFTYSAIRMVLVGANEALSVYPNPATDRVIVELGNQTGTAEKLELLSATGRVIRSIPARPGSRVEVDLQGLSRGVYLVRTGSHTRRLVKR